jgi:hypothetical protein
MHKWLLNRIEIEQCLKFAVNAAPHTFPRTSKSKEHLSLHITRIFIGKLGEYGFLLFLKQHAKCVNDSDIDKMLAIFAGQSNVDKYDIKCKEKI